MFQPRQLAVCGPDAVTCALISRWQDAGTGLVGTGLVAAATLKEISIWALLSAAFFGMPN
jgi:hypothetical protein